MIRVTIREIGKGGKIWTRKNDVKMQKTALEATIMRFFGKHYRFVEDMRDGETLYGQILDHEGLTRKAGYVRVEFTNE